MNAGRRIMAAAMAFGMLAACASPGVRSTRSVALPSSFDRNTPLKAVATLPDIAPAKWGPCSDQDAPWQCATIKVPLDYRRPTSSAQISVALTRLPATDTAHRIGSLVLNPGGPGGSGLHLAWGYASAFPKELLARFDLVGFDPRGVGRSTAVDCGNPDRPFRVFERDCARNSGDLLPYLGTANAARDMEMMRKAIGDDKLTYLGFSYGTALGAVYADMFPNSVRALVLDGSVDPQAGQYNVDGTIVASGNSPFYGVQDFAGTFDVFLQLCDATRSCPAGPHTAQMANDVLASVDSLPLPDFKTKTITTVDRVQFEQIITSAMYNTDLWLPLALGIKDAEEGDASMLAALMSFLQAGYPRQDDSYENESQANLAIYCADFAGREGDFVVSNCADLPETAEPLPPIAATHTTTPIVVIGTDGDPATPGFLAPQMATALGDAVSVRWQGAGHTAFLHSTCVDTIVIDYLVDLTVPKNHATCNFVAGTNTEVARANEVFQVDRQRYLPRLTATFHAEGRSDKVAACMAEGMMADASDAAIVYARFGVQRSEYTQLRAALLKSCGG